MRPLIDTNILVDFLLGNDLARVELSLYDDPAISLITWMEVLVGAKDAAEESALKDFLSGFRVILIDFDVASAAIGIRKQWNIRLPDAIIWATAQHLGLLLVTRNTRDFPSDHPGIRVPYRR